MGKPNIDFSLAEWERYPLQDPGDKYSFRILTALRPKPERIIAIGGRWKLFFNLLSLNYPVIHISLDEKELAKEREVLETLLTHEPELLGRIESRHLDFEKKAFEFRKEDAIFFLNSLHHIQDPHTLLKEIRTHLSSGWIIVEEQSLDLIEKYYLEPDFAVDPRPEHGRYQDPQTANQLISKLEDVLREGDAPEEGIEQMRTCVRGLQRVGFWGEEAVREFLSRADSGENFWYSPDFLGRGVTAYWFTAKRIERDSP